MHASQVVTVLVGVDVVVEARRFHDRVSVGLVVVEAKSVCGMSEGRGGMAG